MERNVSVLTSTATFSETFLILRRTERDVIRHIYILLVFIGVLMAIPPPIFRRFSYAESLYASLSFRISEKPDSKC